MKRSYEGVPYEQLTPAMKADLDRDVRAVLEDADRVAAGAVDEDQRDTLDDAEWLSLLAQGPPR